MGRGAQAQTQQMIDQQLSQQNAMNQQLYSSEPGARLAGRGGLSESARQSRLHGRRTIGDYEFVAVGAGVHVQCARAKRRQSRRAHAQLGRLRRADRLPRAHARPEQANLAQQNQIAFANAARSDTLSRLSGPLRPVRHGHIAARQRDGVPATAQRASAKCKVKQFPARLRSRRLVVRHQWISRTGKSACPTVHVRKKCGLIDSKFHASPNTMNPYWIIVAFSTARPIFLLPPLAPSPHARRRNSPRLHPRHGHQPSPASLSRTAADRRPPGPGTQGAATGHSWNSTARTAEGERGRKKTLESTDEHR